VADCDEAVDIEVAVVDGLPDEEAKPLLPGV